MWRRRSMWRRAAGLAVPCIIAAAGMGCREKQTEAEKAFIANIGNTTIAVYPTLVRGKEQTYDPAAAATIAAWLNDHKIAAANVVGDEQPKIAGPGHINELKMWWESEGAFAAYIKEHPPEAQYALIAEYLGVGDGDHEVLAVHCYIVTKDGELAWGVLQNSHHPAFQRVKPRTGDDCTRVLLDAMQEHMIDDLAQNK